MEEMNKMGKVYVMKINTTKKTNLQEEIVITEEINIVEEINITSISVIEGI